MSVSVCVHVCRNGATFVVRRSPFAARRLSTMNRLRTEVNVALALSAPWRRSLCGGGARCNTRVAVVRRLCMYVRRVYVQCSEAGRNRTEYVCVMFTVFPCWGMSFGLNGIDMRFKPAATAAARFARPDTGRCRRACTHSLKMCGMRNDTECVCVCLGGTVFTHKHTHSLYLFRGAHIRVHNNVRLIVAGKKERVRESERAAKLRRVQID